ncbi:MAG: hypothetical protein WD022_10630 [Balneolaceae bacterium]
MGWFVGILGKNQSLKKKLPSLFSEAAFQTETESFFIAGGGLDSTFHFKNDIDSKSGWIASGIGISTGDAPHLFHQSHWDNSIEYGADYLHKINGHFAVAKWDEHQVELITDQLGMRNIFLHKGDNFIVFSTRLDWIIKLVPKASIAWRNFGSRWLAINQFSSQSFVHKIQRISQGGVGVIKANEVKINHQRWQYKELDTSPEDFKNSLLAFSTIPLKDGRSLSLGLSGGLDSRTLLATLLQVPEQDWVLHTFGEKDHPDLQTAAELNRLFGRTHHIFHEKIPNAQLLEKLIPEYIGQTLFTASPSHLVGFQAYQRLSELNLSVVDGAFGEIARRRFMVSILLRAKKAVVDKDVDSLLPHLKLQKADIFTEDCNMLMLEGFRQDLSEELHAMPDTTEIGLENWLDFFTIRTRVHNTAGPEQARSDAYLLNYMPFLQPELIQQALNLPLHYRKNAKLFRQHIKEVAPELQKSPLIKGSVSYPYWMKDVSSALWMRIKQKLGKHYSSTLQADFLIELEEYVRDIFSSQSAQEFPAYDHQKIEQLITGFYDDKNMAIANELNWCLAFEVFRRL